jgi:hypothetical protein
MANSHTKEKFATSRLNAVSCIFLKNPLLEGFGGQVIYLPVGVVGRPLCCSRRLRGFPEQCCLGLLVV